MEVFRDVVQSSQLVNFINTMIHTLWQGLAISITLFLLLHLVQTHQSRLRYILSLAALVTLVLSAIATWA